MTRIRNKKIAEDKLKLRSQLWPEVSEGDIWNRKKKTGFTTIPRAMPLIMRIIDAMSPKGKPASAVYLELWCRAFDEHVIKFVNKEEMAFHAGFKAQRALQPWTNRIDLLAKLGFIKLAPGPQGKRSYALILNPYKVVKKHFEGKKSSIPVSMYNALLERASEIKADDLD